MSTVSTATMLLVVTAAVAGCGGGRSLPQPTPTAEGADGLATAGVPSPTLRIGPGDLLEVSVFEAPELSGPARVAEDGTISLPVLGSVKAAGLSATELTDALETRLRGAYMIDPQVSVDVAERRSQPIYVLGAVNKPGAFPLSGYERLTFLRALALGEGLRSTASGGRAFIVRTRADGQRIEIPVEIDEVIAGEGMDPPLQPNDVVYVPESRVKALGRGLVDALVRMVTLRGIF